MSARVHDSRVRLGEKSDDNKNDKHDKNKTEHKDDKGQSEDSRSKYHNDAYTYAKLRSLNWMGGPYKNKEEPAVQRLTADEEALQQQL